MHDKRGNHTPVLPGNKGQFGESVATETYKPLRATQRVAVKPVALRQTRDKRDGRSGRDV